MMGIEPTLVSRREANKFIEEMKGVDKEMRAALEKAAHNMKLLYDEGQRLTISK